MKVIDFEPENVYVCQNCFREFKTDKIFVIEPGFYPICSKKCEFELIYLIIEKLDYSNETLELMQKNIEKKDKIEPFNRQRAILSISKYYAKLGLSSIKCLWTLDIRHKQLDKETDNWTLDIDFPPYVIGGNVQSLSNKEGLSKWL